jgi:hypothetical protein
LNVNSVFGRFARFGGWCRLKLLNNDDLLIALIAESIHTKKSKAVKKALPLHPRSPGGTRPAERLTRTKSKIGLDQGNADSEDKTENYSPGTTRQSHTIFSSLVIPVFLTGGFLLPGCTRQLTVRKIESGSLSHRADFCTARRQLRNLCDPKVDLDGLRTLSPLRRGI